MPLSDLWTNPTDGSVLRRIPAGEFVMGSTPEQIAAAAAMDQDGPQFVLGHEAPQFRASCAEFYIGIYAVTNAQFARFLNHAAPSEADLAKWVTMLARFSRSARGNRYKALPGFERHPVVHVSWHGAAAYCAWAGLRLPSEIEWEKAARGDDGRLFPWGDRWEPKAVSWWESHDDDHDTLPVDAMAAGRSRYGLFQMAGNVEEWCDDWYHADAYRRYATGDLTPPRSGPGKVVRGGNCMRRNKLEFRCAMRRCSASAYANIVYTGIRCACAPSVVDALGPGGGR